LFFAFLAHVGLFFAGIAVFEAYCALREGWNEGGFSVPQLIESIR